MRVEDVYATLKEVSGLPDVLDELRPHLRHEPRHAQRVRLQRDPKAHPPESERSEGVELLRDKGCLPRCDCGDVLFLGRPCQWFSVAADAARDPRLAPFPRWINVGAPGCALMTVPAGVSHPSCTPSRPGREAEPGALLLCERANDRHLHCVAPVALERLAWIRRINV